MHIEELKNSDRRLLKNEASLQKRHHDAFNSWIADKVGTFGDNVSTKVKWLANGPREDVTSHLGYIINGQRFHTKDVERCT